MGALNLIKIKGETMNKTKEKHQLLKEAGMMSRRQEIANEIKRDRTKKAFLRTISVMTAMKFKMTSIEEIRAKICGLYVNWKEFVWPCFVTMAISFIPVVAITSLVSYAKGSGSVGLELFIAVTGTLVIGVIGGLAKSVGISRMENTDLKRWTGNLPLGALYAVKEAKERGLSHFKIFFPITEERQRIKADPVIVGYYKPKIDRIMNWSMGVGLGGSTSVEQVSDNSTPIEIFAWDDGKVYD